MARSRPLLVALAAAGALALAACGPGALDPEPSQDAPTQAPPPSDAPADPNPSAYEPPPSVPPTVPPVSGDLDVACDTVLTPDQVYEFNPQMLATATPTSSLPAAFTTIADEGGVVCAWEHVSSGDLLLVGVAPADAVDVATLDCAPLTCADATADDRVVVAGSRYFEGAEEQGRAIAQQAADNLG